MKPVASLLLVLSVQLFSASILAEDFAKAKQEGRIVFYT
jgi:hypothetical protein